MVFHGPRPLSFRRIALLVILLAVPTFCEAANHYIWCGASFDGDGTSLTNPAGKGQPGAYNDLPGSLTRGDTYYVAGDPTCIYAPHTFNDVERGASVISVLKVTSAQSGVTGYTSAMAANPAKWVIANKTSPETLSFPEWPICQGYYTFDGITGGTDPIAGPGGQGFVLQSSGSMPQGHIYIASNTCGGGSKTFNNITLHHIEVRTSGTDSYSPMPVTACSYGGGVATITTNTPGWSQGWLVNDYVSGSTSDHFVSFGISGSPLPIASVSGNTVTVALGSSPCSNLAFLELDIGGSGGVGGYAIYAVGLNNVYNNLDIQYDYLHNSGFDNISYFNWGSQGSGSVIAHNYITGNIGWPQSHGQPIETAGSSGLTVAYNFFLGGMGTAVVFNNSIVNVDGHATNMAFYGNIITETGTNLNNSGWTALIEDATPVAGCGAAGNSPINGLVVYNNTIANTNAGKWDLNLGVIENPNNCSSNWTIKDNLWYNSVHVTLGFPAITEDYNTLLNTDTAGWTPNTDDFQTSSGSINPFISTLNLNLSSETVDPHLNDGVTLPSPYNVDFTGNTRGADGTWKRGAYESKSNRPSPPPNLKVIGFH
jgi:hypothetical protein